MSQQSTAGSIGLDFLSSVEMTQGTQHLYFKFHCNKAHPLLVIIGLHRRSKARSPTRRHTRRLSISAWMILRNRQLPVHGKPRDAL
jgi:hypothetical protein